MRPLDAVDGPPVPMVFPWLYRAALPWCRRCRQGGSRYNIVVEKNRTACTANGEVHRRLLLLTGRLTADVDGRNEISNAKGEKLVFAVGDSVVRLTLGLQIANMYRVFGCHNHDGSIVCRPHQPWVIGARMYHLPNSGCERVTVIGCKLSNTVACLLKD
jgi:hypothetical protein